MKKIILIIVCIVIILITACKSQEIGWSPKLEKSNVHFWNFDTEYENLGDDGEIGLVGSDDYFSPKEERKFYYLYERFEPYLTEKDNHIISGKRSMYINTLEGIPDKGMLLETGPGLLDYNKMYSFACRYKVLNANPGSHITLRVWSDKAGAWAVAAISHFYFFDGDEGKITVPFYTKYTRKVTDGIHEENIDDYKIQVYIDGECEVVLDDISIDNYPNAKIPPNRIWGLLNAEKKEQETENIEVELDFTEYQHQLDAPDGASICQWDIGAQLMQDDEHVTAWNNYSMLEGFEDNSGDFKKFLEVCFSTEKDYGMGLSHIWLTPTHLQSPKGSLSNNFSKEDMLKQRFNYYDGSVLKGNINSSNPGHELRGHSGPFLAAAFKLARQENIRILPWVDLHFNYPRWLLHEDFHKWAPEENYEKAALYLVYFVKYLVDVYGIPIHALSPLNEPLEEERFAKLHYEDIIRFTQVLREKLDEAGLYGVRLIPATFNRMSRADSLIQVLKKEEFKAYQNDIDIIVGHHFGAPPIKENLNEKTRIWVGSGGYVQYMNAASTNSMGEAQNIDEVIRMNMHNYKHGYAMCGLWQFFGRLGVGTIEGGSDIIKPGFDALKDGNLPQILGAAAVYPYLRPGMHMVKGSTGNSSWEQWSVDAFGGKGSRDCIVITNNAVKRNYTVSTKGIENAEVEIHQAEADQNKVKTTQARIENGQIKLSLPKDSVTTIVLAKPLSQVPCYLVVKDKDNLTEKENSLIKEYQDKGYKLIKLNQELSEENKVEFTTKRHPVDPMAAALYLLGDSVDSSSCALAYRTVMAEVINFSQTAGPLLGLNPGDTVQAGMPLTAETSYDTPGQLLEEGMPLACGKRSWQK